VTPGSNKLYIIDARPKLNAVANMVWWQLWWQLWLLSDVAIFLANLPV
jgi:hypothetical protein